MTKIIDWELGAKLAGGSKEMAEELMGMLIEALPEHEAEISAAIESDDHETLYTAAHKLHGATCYTATPRLKDAVKTLEDAAKGKSPEDIKPAYDNMVFEIQQLRDALV